MRTSNQSPKALPNKTMVLTDLIVKKHSDAYREEVPELIKKMRADLRRLAHEETYETALVSLKHEAHDMKGQAGTFGLPGLAEVAASLHKVLELCNRDHPKYIKVVDVHISTLVRMLRDGIADRVEGDAKILIEGVKKTAKKILKS